MQGMKNAPRRGAGLGLVIGLALMTAAGAQTTGHDHSHDHSHSHDHAHSADRTIYKGYFEDHQIQPRALSDWEGDWQSVYPLLVDGTLDPVMMGVVA